MRFVGKIIFIGVLLLMCKVSAWSQACTTLGQTPYTAFPICGDSVFKQATVPACVNKTIPTNCPPVQGVNYDDRNPFWYKFTCFKAGKLGFLITPLANDDYDWELFDVTNRNPGDVYTDKSLIVCYNWSGLGGVTGTSNSATSLFECSSVGNNNPPIFSMMPDLIAGHDYLLMIGHFTPTNQQGYTLSIEGGTAVITDPATPGVQGAYGVCDGTEIVVKLNKRMKCASLAADGSDFSVSGPVPVSIKSATGINCNNSFDMDSVRLKLNTILAPGTYTITIKSGTDNNTLLDNCSVAISPGTQVKMKFLPAAPTPMDSISPVVCIKDTLQLVFGRPMDCNTIAADGSDFTVTGPVPVTVKSAGGVCSNGVSTVVRVVLSSPIRVNGNFTITLKAGSDGNTLLDECGFVTPAGSSLPFTTKNITTADFQTIIGTGCKSDTAFFTHNGYGGTTQWQWSIDSVPFSTTQNPVYISKLFTTHTAQLAVYNGFCRDTAKTNFTFPDHTVKAGFAAADTLCPTDTLHFTDKSTSNTTAWEWNFGNGNISTLQFPPAQTYPLTGRRTSYIAKLSVQNSFGCSDTAYKMFTVLASCYIAVPTAFTPNGDGLNDYLYPLNAFKADNMIFRIYNRYGQVVFESKEWTRKWDGRINSIPQPAGTYVWTFDYTDHDTGKKVSLRGTSVLIR